MAKKKGESDVEKKGANWRLPVPLITRFVRCAKWKLWNREAAAMVAVREWCDKIEAERKEAGE